MFFYLLHICWFCFDLKRGAFRPLVSLLAGSAGAIVTAQTRRACTIRILIVVLNFRCHNFYFDFKLTTQSYYAKEALALRN